MVLCRHYFAYLVLGHDLTLENFQLNLLVVFEINKFFQPNERLFQEIESSLNMYTAKPGLSNNPILNCLELYNVLV